MKILVKIIFELVMMTRRLRASLHSLGSMFKQRANANPGTAKKFELKLAHFMPPRHPMHKGVMETFSEDISNATEGKLRVRIYPSGELGKGAVPQYKRVISGVTDLAFGITAYTPQQFPKTTLAHLPGLFNSAKDATNAIWDNMEQLKPEFMDVKLLGLWTNNPAVFISREKPIRSIEDMKGLKVRAPNPAMSKVVESWGSVPMSMPMTEIYNSMNASILDVIILGPSGIGSHRLNEISKYITTNLPTVVDTFYILMNKQIWSQLNEDQKVIFNENTGRTLSLRGAGVFFKAGQAGLRTAQDSDVELIEAEEDSILEMREAMGDALNAHISQISRQIGGDVTSIVEGLSSRSN